MMPADDTRGDVWATAWAWEGLACGERAACGEFVDLRIEGRGRRCLVAGGKRASRDPGDLPRPCRADAVAAP